MIEDPINEALLKAVLQGKTIPEMSEITGFASTQSVHARLQKLERKGYIEQPRRHIRLGRRLTQQGVDYLVRNGFVSEEDGKRYLAAQRLKV